MITSGRKAGIRIKLVKKYAAGTDTTVKILTPKKLPATVFKM